MNKEEFLQMLNLTEEQFPGSEPFDADLNLRSVTSAPEGFDPGYVFIASKDDLYVHGADPEQAIRNLESRVALHKL